MKHIPHLKKRLSAWGCMAIMGAALLLTAPCSASAAPDQKRLDRPHPSLKDTRSHDFKAERDRSRAERSEGKRLDHDSERTRQDAASVFSDRAFLSAALAREETAAELARDVLRTRTQGGRQIEAWATQVLDSTEENCILLEKALHDEGGIDQHAYGKARNALKVQEARMAERPASARFVMFLFPYCEQTMAAAIPALLESPREQVSALAADLLIERAKLGLEIRRWLHTHHYRNDI